DFNLPNDASAPKLDEMWVATDGGVYRRYSGNWVKQNSGLHTHHVFGMSLVSVPGTRHIIYATRDNSSFFTSGSLGVPFNPSVWSKESPGNLGDADWTAADIANPSFALAVNHATDATTTNFQH